MRTMALRGSVVMLVALMAACVMATPSSAADAITPPGASFGLVPPEGFVVSEQFTGFVDPATLSSIVMVEMPAEAYAQIESKLDPATFAASGVQVQAIEPFTAAGLTGMLVTGTQSLDGLAVDKWGFFFPADAFTGIVNVSLRHDAALLSDAEVRAMLDTIVVGTTPSLAEAAARLPFTFEQTQDLRLVSTFGGNAAVLTVGPKTEVTVPSQPTLIISTAASLPCPTDLRPLAEASFHSAGGFEATAPPALREIEIAEGRGLELLVEGRHEDTGVPLRRAHWVGPVGSSVCLVLIGVAPADGAEAAFAEFRKVLSSVAVRRQ